MNKEEIEKAKKWLEEIAMYNKNNKTAKSLKALIEKKNMSNILQDYIHHLENKVEETEKHCNDVVKGNVDLVLRENLYEAKIIALKDKIKRLEEREKKVKDNCIESIKDYHRMTELCKEEHENGYYMGHISARQEILEILEGEKE